MNFLLARRCLLVLYLIVVACSTNQETSDGSIERAFAERRGNLQVAGEGIVDRVLSDDREGNPHQRFIVRLSSGQTILIQHNIKLAPRIDDLRSGDRVSFFGEYEWNAQGGIVHWTHHDPAGRHVGGWLKHGGRTYE